MRTFLQDLRYGLRMLAKSPGFTAAALLTLTLGIGATAAIFSVVDAVLLRALPFRDPRQLVAVYEDVGRWGFPRNTPAPGNYADWKAQTQVFQDVAASAENVYNLSGKGEDPEKLAGERVTHNLFSVLGVNAELGRVFTADEDRPGFEHAALISHELWTRRFGADRKIIGREILLNNEKYAVIGVLPAGFHIQAKNADIWTPIAFTPERLADRGGHYLAVIGRLQPGVTVAKANAALQVLLNARKQQYPDDLRVMDRFYAVPLQVSYTYEVRRGLVVLMAAVGFILLIACANIANLLLSRAAGRQRELAVRTALGANRARLVRQLLTESGLMAIGGGALGIILADWCFIFLKNLIPTELSRTVALSLDLRVLAFTVAISLACSLLFGLAPALQISRIDLNDVLKQGGRGNVGASRNMFRSLLVVSEVALSLVLLVGSALMIESFANLRGLNPGFHADHVLTMRLEVPDTKYGNFVRRTQFFQTVLERVRTLPGVKVAGITSALPLTWKGGTSGFTPEHIVLPPGLSNDANNRVVTPGYFEALRIPMVRGRFFDERDGPEAAPVVIINETMARKFWRDQDALGMRMQLHHNGPWFQIVGIVGDVRQMGLNEPPRQEMYFAYWQAEKNWMVPRDLTIRTAGDPMALVAAVKRTIAFIDRDQPVSDIKTMDQWLDEEVASRHVQTTLLGGFAALALILACIGIYGVLAYVVTQRTQEIGVRVALGADSASIFRAVAKQGMALAGAGIVLGVAASLALSHALQSLLFDVKPTDPLTYLAAAGVFAFVVSAGLLHPSPPRRESGPASGAPLRIKLVTEPRPRGSATGQLVHQPIVLFQHLLQPIMRQRRDLMPVDSSHILGRDQRIHDRLFGSLHGSFKNRIQRVVRQHRNVGCRSGWLRSIRIRRGKSNEDVARPVARSRAHSRQAHGRAPRQPFQLRGQQRSVRRHHDNDGPNIVRRFHRRSRRRTGQLLPHRRARDPQLFLRSAIALHQRCYMIRTSHARRRSDAALKSKANHSSAAADIAFRNTSGCGRIHGVIHVFRLYVKSVDVVEPAVPRFRNNWKRPEIVAETIYRQFALVVHLPVNGRVTHHPHAVRIRDEHRAFQEAGFLEPRGPRHLAVAVLRKPSAKRGIVRLFSARPDHGDASADRFALNQRSVAHLNAGDIGDRVQSARRSIERYAQIASSLRLRQHRNCQRKVNRIRAAIDFMSARSFPVISLGCFSPRYPSTVGVMSCSAPPFRKGLRSSSTKMNGTGLVV